MRLESRDGGRRGDGGRHVGGGGASRAAAVRGGDRESAGSVERWGNRVLAAGARLGRAASSVDGGRGSRDVGERQARAHHGGARRVRRRLVRQPGRRLLGDRHRLDERRGRLEAKSVVELRRRGPVFLLALRLRPVPLVPGRDGTARSDELPGSRLFLRLRRRRPELRPEEGDDRGRRRRRARQRRRPRRRAARAAPGSSREDGRRRRRRELGAARADAARRQARSRRGRHRLRLSRRTDDHDAGRLPQGTPRQGDAPEHPPGD
mmetsp:Transcript_21812/g.68346  ORF Transcript_21812/g.68346 Transcript_21812/m.68346 type:complete len:264 (+) Transcript_21812:181-972(+)